MPKLVCTYLLLLTREIVEMSSPVRSATSLRIIGFSNDSSPSRKKGRCKSIIACMVVINVFCRCFTASINPCAASIFCLRNIMASFDSFVWLNLFLVCSSTISVKSRLIRSAGTLRLLRLTLIVPSSYVSTMKSGMICWKFLPIVSPKEAPGRGFNLVISLITSLNVSSSTSSFLMIFSQCLRVNSS